MSGIDQEHWWISIHLVRPAQISETNEHSAGLIEQVQCLLAVHRLLEVLIFYTRDDFSQG